MPEEHAKCPASWSLKVGWGGREGAGREAELVMGWGYVQNELLRTRYISRNGASLPFGPQTARIFHSSPWSECFLFVCDVGSRKDVWVGISLPTFWLFYYLHYTFSSADQEGLLLKKTSNPPQKKLT